MRWIICVLAIVLALLLPSVGSVTGSMFAVTITPVVFDADYVGLVIGYRMAEPATLRLNFSIPFTKGKKIDCFVNFEKDRSKIFPIDLRTVNRATGPDAFTQDVSLTYHIAAAGAWNGWIVFPREQIIYLPDIRQIPISVLLVKDDGWFIHATASRMIAVGEMISAPRWQNEESTAMLEETKKLRTTKHELGL